MTFSVRPLYRRVGLSRPDLEQAKVGVAIQEAIRDVCRNTMLARQTLSYTVTANTNSVGMSLANANPLIVHAAVWKYDTDTDYTALHPVNYDIAEQDEYWKRAITPRYFSQQGETVIVYGTPDAQGNLRISVSYVPTTDVVTAPLPEIAIQAVAAHAEAWLLRLPGPGVSMSAAAMREAEYRRLLSNLLAISMYGETGEVELNNPNGPIA